MPAETSVFHAGGRSGSGERLWLTPALAAELEWLAGEGPPNVARHARIVLACARGISIQSVAKATGVHPNTVRNCMRRFAAQGLHGLLHGGAGKPKNIAFSDAIRDEIARLAMHSAANVGEPYAQWSLRRLRSHLIRRGVVQAISVEGLRQLLRGLPLPAVYWRRAVRPVDHLSPEVRHALEGLAQGARADRSIRAQIVLASSRGLNEAEIAAGLHVGRVTVRRWLRRFRRAGILGLHTLPRPQVFSYRVRQAVIRFANTDPQCYGIDRTSWSLQALRAELIRHRVVRACSVGQLRHLLAGAGIHLDGADMPATHASPAAG
jgi:transposase